MEASLKVDISAGPQQSLHLNDTLVDQLIQAATQIRKRISHSTELNPVDFLNWPGVLESPEPDYQDWQQQALSQFDQALDEFLASREREGTELRKIMQARLDDMAPWIEQVQHKLPQILGYHREKLRSRVLDVAAQVDTERLEQEITYLAQKVDVAEELDRLNTHCDEVRRILEQGGAVGRRLDFLMQELNREANTLASKSIDADTTQASVELKVLIEQMREQVQNIE